VKITKRQLRRIIREEICRINEGDPMSLAAMRRREEDEEARAAFRERPRAFTGAETYISGPANGLGGGVGKRSGKFLAIDKIKDLGSADEVLRHLKDDLGVPIDNLDKQSIEKVNNILG
tara:strand:- start:63 stop:419 length:357 start_codon:yes stop_codon:yes gene_type:complete